MNNLSVIIMVKIQESIVIVRIARENNIWLYIYANAKTTNGERRHSEKGSKKK